MGWWEGVGIRVGGAIGGALGGKEKAAGFPTYPYCDNHSNNASYCLISSSMS